MNRNGFFSSIKASLFRGRFSQSQVNGFNRLLDAMQGQTDRHTAYMLATAYHEGAYTMQPITEYGGRRYFDKYDTGHLAKRLGNTPEADGDGYFFRGRGDVMITGRRNYQLFENILHIPLTTNPDLALDPAVSARILVKGCTEGRFTGKKLSDYGDDFVEMRRVVNGTDDARLIAGYADKFYEAITESGPVVDDGPIVTAKTPIRSTTNMATITGGVSMAAMASEDANGLVGSVSEGFGVDPKFILLAIGLCALAWIFRERIKKMTRYGI